MNEIVKVQNFQLFTYQLPYKREDGSTSVEPVIIIYALGDDGNIYELSGGKWLPIPIDPRNFREMPKPVLMQK